LNSFGGSPLIPAGMHPLDLMGYGSHTVNFNPGPHHSAMPTYYSDAFHHGNGSISAQALHYRQTPVNYTALQ